LKTAAKEGEAVVAGQATHAKQVIANLNASIASLETKLNETESIIQKKESDRQKMEESLTGEIQVLQNEVKKKEEALAGRDGEINDLKSRMEVNLKQVSQLEAEVGEAVNRARIAEQVTESSKAKIVALETQLSETEEIVRTKDASNKGQVANLHARIQELEIEVKNSEELLADRETQVKDLKFKLRALKNLIKQMSPIFRQAEEALG
jgi:chromosome segregation ATPase